MKCRKCGYPTKRGFSLCYPCYQKEIENSREAARIQRAADERFEAQSHYNDNECQMCGIEGALLRRDGLYYCSRCWMIENS